MKNKQKVRNTRNWKKQQTKRATRQSQELSHIRKQTQVIIDRVKLPSQTGAKWNYEPAEAWRGTVVVGKVENPGWWCAGMEGTRRRCVKVQSWGEPFYIDDEDGLGSRKAFEWGGGPDTGHRSLPVDDPSSFIPD